MANTINTLSNDAVTGVMKVLLERTNDMGIDCVKAGEFNRLEELIALYGEYYPWNETSWGDVEQLLECGYLDIDNGEISELSIVDNAMYVRYHAVTVFDDLCESLIYDKRSDNYLLGFSNTGWARIDAAIDLATQSVGYFNADNGEYRKAFELSDTDGELLDQIIQNLLN